MIHVELIIVFFAKVIHLIEESKVNLNILAIAAIIVHKRKFIGQTDGWFRYMQLYPFSPILVNTPIVLDKKHTILSSTVYLLDKIGYLCSLILTVRMKNIILNQRAERDELMARPYQQRDTRYNFDDNLLLENWDEDLVMQMLDDVYPGYECPLRSR